MDSWDVESSPGAHDGLVMLVDLNPGDSRHGQVAMYTDARHASSELPSTELELQGADAQPAGEAPAAVAGVPWLATLLATFGGGFGFLALMVVVGPPPAVARVEVRAF